jgi:hypothetical protein
LTCTRPCGNRGRRPWPGWPRCFSGPGIYRSGQGLPYPEYGADARLAIANFNRPIVADEKVADTFTAPGDEVERLNYGFSFWHCLPASRAETPSVAAGTVLRTATVREWSGQAGFASLEVLPVDHLFWRFYRLTG